MFTDLTPALVAQVASLPSKNSGHALLMKCDFAIVSCKKCPQEHGDDDSMSYAFTVDGDIW